MRRQQVAILDDDQDLREILGELIERLSHCEVLVFASLAEMQAARRDVLISALIFLDVDLGPGVPNGLEAFHWLKLQSYPGQILFLTAHAKNHPFVKEALKFENVALKTKPIPHTELLREVRSALATAH